MASMIPEHTIGPSTSVFFLSSLLVKSSGLDVMTMFRRSFSGRNLGGMLSHVLRPMSTALIFLLPSVETEGIVRFVTRAKKPISFFSCGQGRTPSFPMPRLGVAARIKVSVGGLGGMAEFSFDVVVGSAWVEGCELDIALRLQQQKDPEMLIESRRKAETKQVEDAEVGYRISVRGMRGQTR